MTANDEVIFIRLFHERYSEKIAREFGTHRLVAYIRSVESEGGFPSSFFDAAETVDAL